MVGPFSKLKSFNNTYTVPTFISDKNIYSANIKALIVGRMQWSSNNQIVHGVPGDVTSGSRIAKTFANLGASHLKVRTLTDHFTSWGKIWIYISVVVQGVEGLFTSRFFTSCGNWSSVSLPVGFESPKQFPHMKTFPLQDELFAYTHKSKLYIQVRGWWKSNSLYTDITQENEQRIR